MQTENRIEYIDVLKGIAIFLVVFEHTSCGCDIVFKIISKFNIPIFFLCSGFLYRNKFNTIGEFALGKMRQLLIPFVVFAIFTIFLNKICLSDFIFDIGKNGYWFLLCLFEILLIYSYVDIVSNRFGWLVINLAVEALFIGCIILLPNKVNCMIGFSYLAWYYPCFIAGIVIKKHTEISNGLYALLILTLVLMFFLEYIYSGILNFVIWVLLYQLIALFAFYYTVSIKDIIPNFLSEVLRYLGKNSLGIYLVHFYFVIPVFVVQTQSVVLNLLICIVLSALSIALSMLPISIIKSTPYTKWIIGS